MNPTSRLKLRLRALAPWIPGPIRHRLNRLVGATTEFRGPFASFAEAQSSCVGYDDPRIVDQVEASVRQVLAGAFRYEQDGALFRDEPPADYALTGVLLADRQRVSRLHVLDLGGGLGSHFLRWKPILAGVPELKWTVLEQAGFADRGARLHSGDSRIEFISSLENMVDVPDAILASSVLQYLSDPAGVLGQLAGIGAKTLVIDRMPVHPGSEMVALSQHSRITGGLKCSYPLWAFPVDWLELQLSATYVKLYEFPGLDAAVRAGHIHACYGGSIWTLLASPTGPD